MYNLYFCFKNYYLYKTFIASGGAEVVKKLISADFRNPLDEVTLSSMFLTSNSGFFR